VPSCDDREREALKTYQAYVDQHTGTQRGEAPWSSIGDFFTEDCVFIDPAWGRIEGRVLEDERPGARLERARSRRRCRRS